MITRRITAQAECLVIAVYAVVRDRRERGWSRLLGRLGHKETTIADTETTTVHTAEVVR